MGWGISPWGISPWGSLLALAIADAGVATERSITVRFTAPPLAQSPIQEGDVLNCRSWSVTRIANGESLTILAVSAHSPTVYEVWFLERLEPYLESYDVDVSALIDVNRNPIVAPVTFTVLGVHAVKPGPTSSSLVDLKNSAFGGQGNEIAGGLVVGADGDYLVEGGAAMIRKLIVRRLTTLPGEFVHLPEYGIGLKLKEALAISDLVKLRAEIERQILREPELDKVKVQVSLSNAGILMVTVRARMRATNQDVSVPVAVPTQVVL